MWFVCGTWCVACTCDIHRMRTLGMFLRSEERDEKSMRSSVEAADIMNTSFRSHFGSRRLPDFAKMVCSLDLCPSIAFTQSMCIAVCQFCTQFCWWFLTNFPVKPSGALGGMPFPAGFILLLANPVWFLFPAAVPPLLLLILSSACWPYSV